MLKIGSHRIKGLIFSLIFSLIIAALACGQATVGLPSNSTSAEIPHAASATGATLLPNDSSSNPPILIGTEYITIDIPWRVPLLADMLTPLGLSAAKPLPENFAWGQMQRSPDAAIDFARLDNFVTEFQARGVSELVLALRSLSNWASKDIRVAGFFFPLKGGIKEEYLDEYEAWVTAVVERYDADGIADMPGLRAPIHYYEIGVEFSSYEPEPVDEYLEILELAYGAAHRAYPDVLVAHVAFLTTPALYQISEPSEYASIFAALQDKTHSLADMRRILDRPDLFDVLNIHSLGHPYEIEAIVAWLDFETGQRGYEKQIMISDTGSTPFIAWGPATVCGMQPNQMGRLVPPATEVDRCDLADYFKKLVDADAATLQWTQEFIAQDTVKRVVIAAEQGIVLIDTAYTEDLLILKWAIAQAGAGTAAWAGLVDYDRKEYRPVYYGLQQLIDRLGNYEKITRLPFEDPGVRIYEVEDEGQRSWIAWYDPGALVLPGDATPQTTVQIDLGVSSVVVESLAMNASGPASQALTAVDGLISLSLTSTPVFFSISK